ncbi:MAG TPA: hypothetical protein VG934_02450 [Candidatus Paceibacterota bacterium]|nr:hypothetical protein [Candidatus Paceibacterota bacterium]
MTLETMYAQALTRADIGDPKKAIANLREALARRGHEKLLPRILAEYEKLETKQERMEMHKQITPEREQTRMLLQLYRTLVGSN